MDKDRTAEFDRATAEFASVLKSELGSEPLLLHHNDADGLSAGAILAAAFERLGSRPRRLTLEKPFPEALSRIFAPRADRSAVVLTDFGSGMLSELSKFAGDTRRVFVIDHHAISGAESARLHLLNPLQFGISGLAECSAAALAAVVALALSSLNTDLASLGVLGALGDRQRDPTGRLLGINARVADIAMREGGINQADGFRVRWQFEWPAAEIVQALNALGGFGYFEGGPDIAVKGLRDGWDERHFHHARKFDARFESALNGLLASEPLVSGDRIDSFTLGDAFKEFGVKTVGLVCERLIDERRAREDRYLAGFQTLRPDVPGLGDIGLGGTKVSMRVPPGLLARVKAKELPGLDRLLAEATRRVGGFVDACHPHAAATTIPAGSEPRLLHELEQLAAQSA